MPLARPDEEVVHHPNDISEACSTLTFLLQITIIGRESNRKVKIKSIHHMTVVAETLIVIELVVILLDLTEVLKSSVAKTMPKEMDQTIQDASLVFIMIFHFYYFGLIKGFKNLLRTKKKELFIYLLFLTHEYPFVALEGSTHVLWSSSRACTTACSSSGTSDSPSRIRSSTAASGASRPPSSPNTPRSAAPRRA